MIQHNSLSSWRARKVSQVNYQVDDGTNIENWNFDELKFMVNEFIQLNGNPTDEEVKEIKQEPQEDNDFDFGNFENDHFADSNAENPKSQIVVDGNAGTPVQIDQSGDIAEFEMPGTPLSKNSLHSACKVEILDP